MSLLQEWMGLNPVEYNHWEVRWGLDGAEVFLVLLVLMVPPALWFAWTSLARISSRPKKIFLFSLRVFALALVSLLLFQPELDFKKSRLLKNSIAVLLDDSKSLSIKTFPDELTRADFVKSTIEKNRDYLESLKKDFQVDAYLVSDRIDPVSLNEAQYAPHSLSTDFSRVFSQLRKRYEGKPLQGVMLFTDGADLTQEPGQISPDLLNHLAALDVPVHTLQAGSNEMFKDLALSRVEVADFGFIHQPVRVAVTVSAASMGNKNVSLVLRDGENILATQIVELREGVSEYHAELEFTPAVPKRGVYTLTLPLFAGESIAVNNRRDFMVKIVRDRIRVLHLNGRPSWDSRFLREVLASNPKVDLLSFFILRTLGDDVASPTSELSLIPFPTNLLFTDYLNSFDLIIFQNFRYEPFVDRQYLNNIKTFVYNGGAFVMVGGNLSFQGGGYEQTPIEEMLPVRMKRSAAPFSQKTYHLKPRGKILQHPILRLEKDDAANQKIWDSLPGLNGLNEGLTAGKDALVLADDGSGDDAGYPALVAARKGKGRVLTLATDSSWNWNFRRVGEGGSGRYYHKFWNNAIAWLTGEPETGLVQLETDKERYREGEEVLIKFKVFNEDYSPAANKPVKLTLQSVAGEPQAQTLEADADGEGGYQFFPGGEGFFNAHVEIDNGPEKLEQETSFGVFSDTLEFQKPMVNESLLKRMAEATGGLYSVLSENTRLSDLPFANPEVFERSQSKTLSLWDNWWAYALVVGLLLVDWLVRRKSGLS